MQAIDDEKDTDGPVVVTSGNKKAYFSINPFYKPFVAEVLIPEGLIASRIEKLASQVADFYGNKPYTILVVIKGGYKVFHKLNEYLEKIYESGLHYNSVKCEFIRLSSYSGVQSEGDVDVVGLDLLDLKDKDVLIVDVICDSGLSQSILFEKLQVQAPKSVKLLTLLIKEHRTKFKFNIDFIGFQIPSRFVVGYGLDYNENFRDINHIVVLNDSGLDKYKKKKSIFSSSNSKQGKPGSGSLVLDLENEHSILSADKVISQSLPEISEIDV